MKIQDHVKPIEKKARDSFTKMLADPECWSDTMIKKTLELGKGSGKPFDMEDVRHIVKDYLKVLSDAMKQAVR